MKCLLFISGNVTPSFNFQPEYWAEYLIAIFAISGSVLFIAIFTATCIAWWHIVFIFFLLTLYLWIYEHILFNLSQCFAIMLITFCYFSFRVKARKNLWKPRTSSRGTSRNFSHINILQENCEIIIGIRKILFRCKTNSKGIHFLVVIFLRLTI